MQKKSKKKLKEKHFNWAFTLIINLGMCLYMSTCMHLVNVGPHGLVNIWLKNFIIALVLSMPFAFLYVAIVAKLMHKFFDVE